MSRSYHQLDLDERELIFRMRDALTPVRRIAARLGRHVSTIYRELKRNFFYDEDPWFRGYFPRVAHRIARSRRMRGSKIARNAVLATNIAEGLPLAWSPEQIAGHARMADGDAKVCPETIYQYVYSPEGRWQDLWRYGYRRVHVLLRREGWEFNMKRTHRIYNELGLQLRNKTPKRKVKAKLREDRCAASRVNDVWAMDLRPRAWPSARP